MSTEGNESVKSTTGWSRIWRLISISASDLASRQMTAARLPPALSPDTLNASFVPPSASAAFVGPHATLVRIGEGGRERMLGRKTVVDRDYDVAGGFGKPAAERVGLGDPALHVSAAVKVHHDGHRTIGFRREHAHLHGAHARIKGPVLNVCYLDGDAGGRR